MNPLAYRVAAMLLQAEWNLILRSLPSRREGGRLEG
jgi:hypothetical protein